MGLGSALQPCKYGQGRLAREVLCCPGPAVSLSTPVRRRSQAGGQFEQTFGCREDGERDIGTFHDLILLSSDIGCSHRSLNLDFLTLWENWPSKSTFDQLCKSASFFSLKLLVIKSPNCICDGGSD